MFHTSKYAIFWIKLPKYTLLDPIGLQQPKAGPKSINKVPWVRFTMHNEMVFRSITTNIINKTSKICPSRTYTSELETSQLSDTNLGVKTIAEGPINSRNSDDNWLKKRKSGKEKMNTVDTYVSEDFWHCNQVYKSKRREKPVKLH